MLAVGDAKMLAHSSEKLEGFLAGMTKVIELTDIASSHKPASEHVQLLGRGPHKNCKNDLDDQT